MFYKKIILSSILTLTATTGLNALSQPTYAAETVTQEVATTYTNPFNDVQKNNTYYAVIHTMRDMGIINGYADNTFKPSEPINRQNGAAMITRYTPVKYGRTTKFPTLTDVTTKNGNYNALVQFQKTGIYSVAKDGKIYPTKAMTRGEMAKAITLAFGLKVDSKATTKLKDVPSSLKPYVAAIEKAGITTGYEDSTFRPAQTLTRAHFAVFMHRAIEYKEQHETVVEKPVTPPVTPPKEENKEVVFYDQAITPKEAYAGYSTKLEEVEKEHLNSPKLNGMSPAELRKHQTKAYESAREDYRLYATTKTAAFGMLESAISGYMNATGFTREEVIQIMNYVQSTGNVYTSEKFTLYYAFQEVDYSRHFISAYSREQ